MTFHSDAWLAIVLLMVSIALMFFARSSVRWHWAAVVVAGMACVPLIQYGFGQIPFFGVAWINATYLLGLCTALLLGAYWERASPGQCADFLFLALGLAGMVSVGIQIHQWLLFDSLEFWVNKALGRPYGNLGQPNQLATLLVLGLLGCSWGFVRKQLSAWSSILLAGFFLLGIALTQSRTGWLNVSIFILAMFCWGWTRSQKRIMVTAVGLGTFFVVCVLGLSWLSDLLQLTGAYDLSGRFSEQARPVIWRLLADAAWEKPWFGYGWGQTGFAHLQVAASHPFLGVIFFEAHNLFLDLILWNGIPLGVFVVVAMTWWLAAATRAVKGVSDAILLLFLLVLGVHAMLEYPLHYAYFLLPAGLVAGVLNVRLKFRPAFISAHWVCMVVLLGSGAMLAVTVRDYIRVESSFADLRFEKARIHTNNPGSAPELWVLTQLREMIIFGRTEARPNMSDQELVWMRDVTKTYPSPYNAHKLALALALNGQGVEAQLWLKNLCKAFPVQFCEGTRITWAQKALKEPAIAAVPWPANVDGAR
ncbi:Wzy polymerase domain-containing protein [Polaromonas sp. UC242_47]|uniref:PglL family O-oligosaccharyltransferase n=1 Tax=Polaromonas sp. UC242_47 TaxID=3374626 RepID=UPI00379A38D1